MQSFFFHRNYQEIITFLLFKKNKLEGIIELFQKGKLHLNIIFHHFKLMKYKPLSHHFYSTD